MNLKPRYKRIIVSYTLGIDRTFYNHAYQRIRKTSDQEKIEASYTDGVLKIDIAKREEAKAVRKQIEIK